MSAWAASANTFESAWIGRTTDELVRVFGSRIYSIAKRITQDDVAAGEVLIDTFLEAWPDPSGCREDKGDWLRIVTIAVRGALSRLRESGDGHSLCVSAADPCEDLVARELSVWGNSDQPGYSPGQPEEPWETALRNLEPMCRTVFVLRDIEDIPVEQIARMVTRSAAAVDLCLLRARLQLGEMLAPWMKGPGIGRARC
jgi:RNA polymerase sigma-70 factor, ECF subfamily